MCVFASTICDPHNSSVRKSLFAASCTARTRHLLCARCGLGWSFPHKSQWADKGQTINRQNFARTSIYQLSSEHWLIWNLVDISVYRSVIQFDPFTIHLYTYIYDSISPNISWTESLAFRRLFWSLAQCPTYVPTQNYICSGSKSRTRYEQHLTSRERINI